MIGCLLTVAHYILYIITLSVLIIMIDVSDVILLLRHIDIILVSCTLFIFVIHLIM